MYRRDPFLAANENVTGTGQAEPRTNVEDGFSERAHENQSGSDAYAGCSALSNPYNTAKQHDTPNVSHDVTHDDIQEGGSNSSDGSDGPNSSKKRDDGKKNDAVNGNADNSYNNHGLQMGMVHKDNIIYPHPPSDCPEQYSNRYFAIRQSSLSGLGAFALRDLKKGTTIHLEKALIQADTRTLYDELEKLAPNLRQAYFRLHVYFGNSRSDLRSAIFQTNG